MLAPKLTPVHTIIGGAPRIASLLASDGGIPLPRIFTGIGAPSATTLPPGNGKYNGLNSGYLTNVRINTAGANYVVGDILTLSTGSGGSGTPAQITVDAVTAAGGLLDYHVSTVGAYTTYPPTTLGVTGGSGTGAIFTLNFPAPDNYLDYTTLTAPVPYVCGTAGTNSTAVWTQVGGGPSQFKIVSDGGDYWNCYAWDGYVLGSTTIKVAKQPELRCSTGAVGSATIRSVGYTYTYTASGSYFYRSTAISGGTYNGTTTTDYMDPDPAAFPYIFAAPYTQNASGVATLVGVAWIDLNVNARYWATNL